MVTARTTVLALAAALLAVMALLLGPATASAAHGAKKQQVKVHNHHHQVQPHPRSSRRQVLVIVVVRQTAPVSSPQPKVSPPARVVSVLRSVPKRAAPVAAAPVTSTEPVAAVPGGGVVIPVGVPGGSARDALPPAIVLAQPSGPATINLALPYQAVGAGTGLLAFLVLALLLIVLRGRRVGEAHLSLARELGVRPRQLAALTAATAEMALAHVRSGRERAMLDDLTGVLRRGPGMAALEREIARARRSLLGRLVVVFVDVDGLKVVNDTLGHAAGDQTLRSVAAALDSRLRGQDLVFRYGGDEFVAVLPDTDGAGARRTVVEIRERLAERVGRKPFSIGLASLREGESAQELVQRADAALYEGRRLGLS